MLRVANFLTVEPRWLRFVSIAFCFFFSAVTWWCTPTSAQVVKPACKKTIDDIATLGFTPRDLSNIDRSVLCFWELFSNDSQQLRRALQAQGAIQKSAATIQPGAPGSSNGTTSAISKPFTPIALATEYGGITSSTSNQTMTLQTTLDAIPAGMVARGDRPYCWSPTVTIPECVKSSTLQHLNLIGLGITANTSTSSQNLTGTAAPAQGTAQQASLKTAGTTAPSFSNAFVKFTLFRGKYQIPDGSDQSILPKADLGTAAQHIRAALASAPSYQNYQKWQKDCVEARFTQRSLAALNDTERSTLFTRYYTQVGAILFGNATPNCEDSAPPISVTQWLAPNQNWTDQQKQLADAIQTYIAAVSVFEAQMLKAASTAPALALEYDYNTPLNQPTTSTIKLVGSRPFGPPICARNQSKKNGNAQGSADGQPQGKASTSSNTSSNTNRFTPTINVGGNFYNSAPSNVPGTGAFRDLQAGAEMDVAFCTSTINVIGSFLGNSTVGLTYYYQDQVSPSILKVTPGMPLPGISITGLASSTSSVFASKGPINFAQLKFGLGTGKNVKFPIAVSWSNRTDLITHSLWSAQFGVSYDFSSLLNSSGSTKASGGSQAGNSASQ